MIGQKGVFARRSLKKHQFLGFYSGHFLQSKEEIQKHHKKIGHANYSTYVFSFKDQKLPIVSGFNIGNRLTLINSPTAYDGNIRKLRVH